MHEATVTVVCPACAKQWADEVDRLPDPDEDMLCPGCDTTASTAEFMQTARDLEILRTFDGSASE